VRERIRPVCAVTNKTDESTAKRIVDREVPHGAEFRFRATTQLIFTNAPGDFDIGVGIGQPCARS
jgi:hypothetical protein